MCGIAGHFAPHGPANVRAVLEMTDALLHRGPDASGHWDGDGVALGYRRLAIIDLRPEANQPMPNEDGSILLVANGEIYNFEELRTSLIARGHTFRSRSDCEVIVHLYEEHGMDFVTHLRGMFAVALWDTKTRTLVLARDRAGKKPLYYRLLPGGEVAFASELHALVRAFPELPVIPDLEAIDEFLTLQYVPSPRTAYQGIFKFPAAHVATVRADGGMRSHRYWSKQPLPELDGSLPELALELRTLLDKAVQQRLVADVPLGAFLSGGIDSSAIVGLMATNSTARIKTFSIGFPDADDSELRWARIVADRYDTDHHEEVVTPDTFDLLVRSIRHHGEPFADSSAVATYMLSEMAARHVTVALSGDGGDETFAGYSRYTAARLAHLYDALPSAGRSVYQPAAMFIAKLFAPHVLPFIESWPEGESARYPLIQCQFSRAEKESLYLPQMRAAMTNATQERFQTILSASNRPSAMGRLIDLDWETYLCDDINAKVDIAAMANSLEVRCPLLDTDVTEFAARLPMRALMGLRGKRVFRRAVEDIVPPTILRRRKRGFGLPVRRWLRGEMKGALQETLLSARSRARELFDPNEVRRWVAKVDTERDAADRVWTLLCLELWFREFVDAPPRR